MGVKCFWIEPTDRCKRSLRRYAITRNPRNEPCLASPCFATAPQYAYHDASTSLEDGYANRISEVEWLKDSGASQERIDRAEPGDFIWRCGPDDLPPQDDPRWPTRCACGYAFLPDDNWQVFTDVIYRRTDTGEEMSLRAAPPGAMWDAQYYRRFYSPTADGRYLMVKCPNGHDWCIDSRASNCTMPDDNVHKCWIRHGEPPNITVSKDGPTCTAGAGSIQAGDYHGFLRSGEFTP